MRILKIVLVYLSIILLIMQNLLWPAGALAVFCSYKYGASPLIAIAILIDGYYGNFYTMPYLSLIAVVWYFFVSVAGNWFVRVDNKY